MINKNLYIFGVMIMLSMLIGSYLLANASWSIRTTDTSVSKDGMLTNSINVSGDGTAIATPDLVTMSFTIEERDFSTKNAMKKANDKITQVLALVKKYGVKEEKVKTTQLSIQPRYEWTDERYLFKGYDAIQSLSVEMNYSKDDVNAPSVLDETSSIEGVRINGITFDVQNKKVLAEEARELAFQSAKEKAEQLAKLSGITLGKPISITDMSAQYNETVAPMAMEAKAFDMLGSSAPSTVLRGGELDHKISLQVVFAIE